ncbi:MAG: 5-histidylcysteine sulfoxide synthase [Campylobacterales bacterium]|nr:5-histidylcysteine sulfoxide synthase [Campylobacterales bacterium]
MSKLSHYPIRLDGNSIEKKRQEIKEYFQNSFSLFEKIFELLKDDSVFYKQSEPTRHPMIFYFGHTATFFINKLILMQIINERVNPEFESIFAVGVDEMAWDDVESRNYQWPQVDAVREYRSRVRKVVEELIDTLEFTLPIEQNSPMWVILMGIEHERIHIETSIVLHRQMPLELVKEHDAFCISTRDNEVVKNELVLLPGKEIHLGKQGDEGLYGWDNEYGIWQESVSDFKVSKYLVSNAEYMEFVKAGGYQKLEYWDDEGRAFLEKSAVTLPIFWVQKGSEYFLRTLTKEIKMPWNWPVEVNALEAEAFCRYKTKKEGRFYSLPSEAEYRVLYEYAGLEDIPKESEANINFAHCSSSAPVDTFCTNGVYDVIGNVWQWSRTPIRAFKGFHVHKAYDDFSTPTFDEKHALILGASWASSGNLMVKHSRYAFRKHFYQNAGFRYVQTAKESENMADIYESDELVSQYCEFQYGDTHFGVNNFALECASIANKFAINSQKALDLGCATGRATFELAKRFEKVEGIDFSARFIQVGTRLKDEGFVNFSSKEEGELCTNKKITMKELGYESVVQKVSFWQGDACNLKPNFTGYDLILATNLIDRLYEPKLFLESVHERLSKDGILVLTSPYTWQESSTKKEFWLGGYEDESGNEVETIDSLQKILADNFELIHLQDLEFVIKETKRKYQHTISEVSVWKKRD